MLLEEVARDSVTQRKLNEGSEMHRIPRKQFTAVFESFTEPRQGAFDGPGDALRASPSAPP